MSDSKLLQIAIFGVLDFRIEGESQHLGLTGPTRSLLQYLFCFHDRLTRREQLMEMFWPNARIERRRSSLNSAIWRIKKALKPYANLDIDAMADCVRLVGVTAPEVVLDVLRLEQALAEIDANKPLSEACLAPLLGALDLCGGVPLDGLGDDWAVIERERLEALRMRGLTLAMRGLAEQKRYDEALEIGRRILVQEPYRECTFQEVLCLLVLNGERARVMQLYDRFDATLNRDLGIRPMAETKLLLSYLAGDGGGAGDDPRLAAAHGSPSGRPGVDRLLCSIEHSREAIRLTA